MRYAAAAALFVALFTSCTEAGEQEELEAGRVTSYEDPEGRFSFQAPDGLDIETVAAGTIVLLRDPAGEVVLQLEVSTPDAEALEHVPVEQHGGEPWLAHLLWRIQAWCAADGPSGTQYCADQESVEEVPGAGGTARAVEVVPLRTVEDFAARTSTTVPIGPVWGATPADDPGGLLLMITPAHREAASQVERDYAEELLSSLLGG